MTPRERAEAFVASIFGVYARKRELVQQAEQVIWAAERAARAQERERCAKIADEHYQGHANWGDDGARVTAGIIAAAIRALPEETTDAT